MTSKLSSTYIMGLSHVEAHATQPTLFSFLYGAEIMVFIEVLSLQLVLPLASKVSDPSDCIYDVEALQEKRLHAEGKWPFARDRLVKPITNG